MRQVLILAGAIVISGCGGDAASDPAMNGVGSGETPPATAPGQASSESGGLDDGTAAADESRGAEQDSNSSPVADVGSSAGAVGSGTDGSQTDPSSAGDTETDGSFESDSIEADDANAPVTSDDGAEDVTAPSQGGSSGSDDDTDATADPIDTSTDDTSTDAPEVTDDTTSEEPGVDTSGDDAPGAGTPEDATTGAPLSFESDIWPLFILERDPVFVYRGMGSYGGCNVDGVCHGGERPGADLRMLDRESTYEQLLEVPSNSGICEGTLRVVPGDPDNSCLILFYVGRLGEEDLDWVDNAEIDLVRQWILDGALP